MVHLLPPITNEQKRAIYRSISGDGGGNVTYYILVFLAAVVATLGLLMGSTAVIIGAMLISPIMGPIIGMSFSMTLGVTKLFNKSLKALALGVGMAIAVSVVVTALSPVKELTPEIISRTKPTVIDLIVALASGAAGAFTMVYKREGAVLPGVAIATALMPPLCVVGIGIVLNEYSSAMGGILLFLANLIAINLASAVIFRFTGFNIKDQLNDEAGLVRKRMLISLTAFVAISIPLSYIMYNTIMYEKTNRVIESSLKESIGEIYGLDLINYNFELRDNKYSINTVVRSLNTLSGGQIRQIENYLEHQLGQPAKVTMRVILTQ